MKYARITGSACIVVGALTSTPETARAQVSPSHVLRIGVEEGERAYTFGRIADASFGGDGLIFVLDALNAEVRVFGADGRYLRSMGRKGEGPGEFLFPTAVKVTPSEVIVVDPPQQRIVRFAHDGTHVTTSRTPFRDVLSGALPMRDGVWLGYRDVVSISDFPRRGATKADLRRLASRLRGSSRSALIAFTERNPRGDTLLTFDHGMIIGIYPELERVGVHTRPWGPSGGWAVGGDSIVATVNAESGAIRILKVQGGQLVTLIAGTVGEASRRLTQADYRAAEAWTRLVRELPRNAYFSYPDSEHLISDPVFADDGALWVRKFRPGQAIDERWQETQYLRVPLGGSAQALVNVPGTILAIRGDLLLIPGRTEFGAQVLDVWRLPRGW